MSAKRKGPGLLSRLFPEGFSVLKPLLEASDAEKAKQDKPKKTYTSGADELLDLLAARDTGVNLHSPKNNNGLE